MAAALRKAMRFTPKKGRLLSDGLVLSAVTGAARVFVVAQMVAAQTGAARVSVVAQKVSSQQASVRHERTVRRSRYHASRA
jgi:hypothetical protein